MAQGNYFSSQSYTSADAASAAWLERYGEAAFQSGIEWSSVIYSFTSGGDTYYGYSPPVSFSNNDQQGRDPHGSAPGWEDPLQILPITFAYKLVGGIHSHLPVSGTPINQKKMKTLVPPIKKIMKLLLEKIFIWQRLPIN